MIRLIAQLARCFPCSRETFPCGRANFPRSRVTPRDAAAPIVSLPLAAILLAGFVTALQFCILPSQGVAQEQAPSRLGSVNDVAIQTELNTVKLYGAGGFRGLDAYQSGFFVSGDGYILTVWSTVLDVDSIIAVTSDGRRMEAELRGIDPNLEIAILATNEKTNNFFDLSQAAEPSVGMRVLAVSNLYGIATGTEMSSVQKGVIMARSDLNARRGTFESVYRGPVAIIDAMTNNPGAAGGALVNLSGKLVGMLGKELRDANASIWLNYAVPISELRESVENIIAGKSINRAASTRKAADRPAQLGALGIVLVPDVLNKTPAYVDSVRPDSIAAKAGLQDDDLLLFVNSTRVASQADLLSELQYLDRAEQLVLLVQRDNELHEIILAP